MKRACIQRAALVLFWSVFIPLPDPYCSHLSVWLLCETDGGGGRSAAFLRASTRYCCFYQCGLLCGGPVACIYLVSHPSSPHITTVRIWPSKKASPRLVFSSVVIYPATGQPLTHSLICTSCCLLPLCSCPSKAVFFFFSACRVNARSHPDAFSSLCWIIE